MASPEVHDWEKAKRIARYLKGKARAIQHFAFGKIAPQRDGFTDSDWAGERPSMKSSSGAILMWGRGPALGKQSRSAQAEAELYAMSRCSWHALSLMSVASDYNIELHPIILTDASAALSIAYLSGAGDRTRHVKVQYLRVQGAVPRKDLWDAKVGSSENPADITKVPQCRDCHSKNVGHEFPVDNFQVLKARDNLAACSELEVRFKNFAKHLGIARAQERWITSQPFFKEAQRQCCAVFSTNPHCDPVSCVRTE